MAASSVHEKRIGAGMLGWEPAVLESAKLHVRGKNQAPHCSLKGYKFVIS